ncbi:hypothetical protein CEXT_384261 [Caerostris extrusa]|uniref:Uncharacterized protein n=1 Tax=Caerostris extrusa TaxID=172846 RepID=A0AAV4WBP1_CAEEX|nr:hypothetical protein CEXT_384261 [Caerostris extrusa]
MPVEGRMPLLRFEQIKLANHTYIFFIYCSTESYAERHLQTFTDAYGCLSKTAQQRQVSYFGAVFGTKEKNEDDKILSVTSTKKTSISLKTASKTEIDSFVDYHYSGLPMQHLYHCQNLNNQMPES